jgi:SOS-response transcriptional repressor LexA
MLTHRQKRVLDYIEQATHASGGVPPSFKEIAQALDIPSKNSVYQAINALERRGFIRRLHERARAIEIIRRKPIERWFRFDDQTKQFVPMDASESPTVSAKPRK